MPYIPPADVTSPKAHWSLFVVLLDEGPDLGAYSLGKWDGTPVIAFRWNGNDERPLGSPQSRGLATWTMLDARLYGTIIDQIVPAGKRDIARQFLGLNEPAP